MANLIKYEDPDKKETKYPYDPKYCQLLLDYAYQNINVDGFYGEYMIPPEVASVWEDEHEDWREAVAMAEYRSYAGLNKSLKSLLDIAVGEQGGIDPKTGKAKPGRAPDIELLQKVIFRMADLSFKTEKDTGMLKRKGQEKSRKAKNNTPTDSKQHGVATVIAQEILNKG